MAALGVLSADVSAAASLSTYLGDTQFARRAFVRAVFALIEGNVNLMAGVVVAAGLRSEITLTSQELAILREERLVVDDAGVVKVYLKFVPMRDRRAGYGAFWAAVREVICSRQVHGWLAGIHCSD